MENQRSMEELRIEIQRQKLELDKSAEIMPQKFEEMFLRFQQEQKKLFQLSNRSHNVENENTFSQNAIWSAIDNFTCAPKDEIKFTSYFRRYEDLYNTDCTNLVDFMMVCKLLRNLGIVEHTKFVNYILPPPPKKNDPLDFY